MFWTQSLARKYVFFLPCWAKWNEHAAHQKLKTEQRALIISKQTQCFSIQIFSPILSLVGPNSCERCKKIKTFWQKVNERISTIWFYIDINQDIWFTRAPLWQTEFKFKNKYKNSSLKQTVLPYFLESLLAAISNIFFTQNAIMVVLNQKNLYTTKITRQSVIHWYYSAIPWHAKGIAGHSNEGHA